MQMNRLFEMIYLLMERGDLTAAELAQRFEVSARTIYRDVDRLSAAGIPVYAAKGRGGGIRLLSDFVLDRSLLTTAQQDEILFALQSLRATNAGGEEGALERLGVLFQRDITREWIEADFSRWGSGEQERAVFRQLRDAILGRKVISFSYYSAWGECNERLVEPMKLRFKGSYWYLQGWCRLREDWRVFKITRMENLRITAESFTPRPQLLPDMDTQPSGRMVTLHLRFAPRAAFRVWDEFERSMVRRNHDGSLEVTARFPDDDWISGYLLSYGDDVCILSPSRYQGILRAKAEKIMALYNNMTN